MNDNDNELIDFHCQRFEAADCEGAIVICLVALIEDIDNKQTYTLLPGALGRMRGVYSRRLKELRELAKPIPDSREPKCVERWPECENGGYDPSCCRFPKSCSCG